MFVDSDGIGAAARPAGIGDIITGASAESG